MSSNLLVFWTVLSTLALPAALLALRRPGVPSESAQKRAAAGFGVAAAAGLAGCLLRVSHHGFGLYLDFLSLVVFSFVSVLGFAVARFSISYLRGEEHRPRFLRHLVLTVVSVQVFVLSGHLLLSLGAWLAMSYGVHRLLRHYDERKAARLAARKKFLFARLGDACFVAGLALVHLALNTFEMNEAFARATSASEAQQNLLNWAAFGFVGAAIFKSAQFPFHAWLPETMEAPTPVSALMHAGVINAGAYLLLRTAPLWHAAHGALTLLMAVGGVTACLGLVVQSTKTEVKRALAWSTIAQMGFLLFELGLGLSSAALLHLMGHGAYKAHAFLRSGTLRVSAPRRAERGAAGLRSYLVGLFVMCAAGVGTLVVVGADLPLNEKVFFAVLVIASAPLFMAKQGSSVLSRCLGFAAVVPVGFGTLLWCEHWLALQLPGLPGLEERSWIAAGVASTIVLSFLSWSVLWTLLARGRAVASSWRLYVHATNGFYLGPLTDRVVELVWSDGPPAAQPSNSVLLLQEPQLELGKAP